MASSPVSEGKLQTLLQQEFDRMGEEPAELVDIHHPPFIFGFFQQ